MENHLEKMQLREVDGDYLLDACVAIAENLRLLMAASIIGLILGLSIAVLRPETYQSTSLLKFSETDAAIMRSVDVLVPVINELQLHKDQDQSLDTVISELKNQVRLTYRKKDDLLELSTEGVSPEAAQLLNFKVLGAFLQFTLPKGRSLEGIEEQIRIASGSLKELHAAALRVGMNLGKVTPGTEAEAMTRSYIAIIEQRDSRLKLLYELKSSLKKAGPEAMAQRPTLPTLPIKTFKSSKVLMALAGMLAFGFTSLLFMWIRARLISVNNDPLHRHKVQRIKAAFGFSADRHIIEPYAAQPRRRVVSV